MGEVQVQRFCFSGRWLRGWDAYIEINYICQYPVSPYVSFPTTHVPQEPGFAYVAVGKKNEWAETNCYSGVETKVKESEFSNSKIPKE